MYVYIQHPQTTRQRCKGRRKKKTFASTVNELRFYKQFHGFRFTNAKINGTPQAKLTIRFFFVLLLVCFPNSAARCFVSHGQ